MARGPKTTGDIKMTNMHKIVYALLKRASEQPLARWNDFSQLMSNANECAGLLSVLPPARPKPFMKTKTLMKTKPFMKAATIHLLCHDALLELKEGEADEEDVVTRQTVLGDYAGVDMDAMSELTGQNDCDSQSDSDMDVGSDRESDSGEFNEFCPLQLTESFKNKLLRTNEQYENDHDRAIALQNSEPKYREFDRVKYIVKNVIEKFPKLALRKRREQLKLKKKKEDRAVRSRKREKRKSRGKRDIGVSAIVSTYARSVRRCRGEAAMAQDESHSVVRSSEWPGGPSLLFVEDDSGNISATPSRPAATAITPSSGRASSPFSSNDDDRAPNVLRPRYHTPQDSMQAPWFSPSPPRHPRLLPDVQMSTIERWIDNCNSSAAPQREHPFSVPNSGGANSDSAVGDTAHVGSGPSGPVAGPSGLRSAACHQKECVGFVGRDRTGNEGVIATPCPSRQPLSKHSSLTQFGVDGDADGEGDCDNLIDSGFYSANEGEEETWEESRSVQFRHRESSPRSLLAPSPLHDVLNWVRSVADST